MIKKIFLDLETTGTEPRLHSIHQISGLVEIDEVIIEEFNYFTQPHPKARYEPAALRIAGKTEEEMKAYPPMKEVHKSFTTMLSKYVDKYDPKDKAFIVGFNNRAFDDFFIRAWFEHCGDEFFGSWFYPDTLDVMPLACEYLLTRRTDMSSFKLKRVAIELGIEVIKEELHNASYDVELTRQIYRIVTGREYEI